MKINEKSLAKYAESGARPPEREGYLLKKGDFHRSYQKRWFVLKGNLLFYFEKRIDKDPIGKFHSVVSFNSYFYSRVSYRSRLSVQHSVFRY
ncbi:hypothetical protein DPMN_013745 [Dreissena polymorpha]|uniref:PH domain-containing protein n=1 Tax=Dreissena polymorpha TaxID=45954 RepID=A0A9D4N4S0_DREPO|nr:hypothetical protein DPMN_013745 [Dreissena polymorpha]